MISHATAEVVDQSNMTMAKQILALLQRSYKVEAELIGANDFPPLRRTLANIQSSTSNFLAIAEPGNLISVAELKKRKESFISEHAVDEEVIEECLFVDSFVVCPGRFRQGLGAALLRSIFQWSTAKKIIADTSVFNEPAIALYKKAGFTELSVYTNQDGFEMIRLKYLAD